VEPDNFGLTGKQYLEASKILREKGVPENQVDAVIQAAMRGPYSGQFKQHGFRNVPDEILAPYLKVELAPGSSNNRRPSSGRRPEDNWGSDPRSGNPDRNFSPNGSFPVDDLPGPGGDFRPGGDITNQIGGGTPGGRRPRRGNPVFPSGDVPNIGSVGNGSLTQSDQRVVQFVTSNYGTPQNEVINTIRALKWLGQQLGVDYRYLLALCMHETGIRGYALSAKVSSQVGAGAEGLFQMTPAGMVNVDDRSITLDDIPNLDAQNQVSRVWLSYFKNKGIRSGASFSEVILAVTGGAGSGYSGSACKGNPTWDQNRDGYCAPSEIVIPYKTNRVAEIYGVTGH
jgi:hypothetical protein